MSQSSMVITSSHGERSKNRSQEKSLSAMLKLERVKSEDLILFTRQFYTLFKAGLSVDVILTTLVKQTQNPPFKIVLKSIKDEVHRGASISQAFAKHPKIFNKLYISMLSAGEEAGILEDVLLEIVKVFEKEDEIQKEISSATLYPKIVIGVMLLASYVILTFVIPKFSALYSKFGADLPLPTRIMVAASNFATGYWYVVLGIVVAGVFAYRKFVSTPQGRMKVDKLKLKAPVFGKLFAKIEMARFGHVFSALYKSGLPMVRTLEILKGIMGNVVYAKEINRIRIGVIQGKSLGDMMRLSHYFPPLTVETTAIGEKTGNLDDMLSSQAAHYDLEIKHMNKNLTTMLEPMLLGGIFGMVLLMVLAVFLPMWNLSNVVMKS